MSDERAFRAAAGQQGYDAAAVDAALAGLRQQLRRDTFYVYRGGAGKGEGGAGDAPSGKPRTIVAFPSGDAALAFAQRNALGPAPRLQRLGLPRLLLALLQQASLEAVLFVADEAAEPPTGRLPAGIRLQRADLLKSLAAPPAPET
jgi:hypothetical protein